MKAEIDSGGIGGEGGGVTTYEMKQLEQQNDRLKEAVMKFRDLSQHEKQENGRLVKVRANFKGLFCNLCFVEGGMTIICKCMFC